MIRALAITASVVAFAAPAFAEDASTPTTAPTVTVQAQLDLTSQSLQARQHLVGQGYINVSDLEKDANGRWFGTAQKNGKTVIVAIRLPDVERDAPATN